LQNLLENARILSFCGRSDSPLLWSHYANAHRGACIDSESEDRVRSIVSRASAPVKVRKAFIDEDTFSVGIR